MKDFIGVEINIGDLAIGSDYKETSLHLYEVIGFTPQRVKIRWYGHGYEATKLANTLLILTKEQESIIAASPELIYDEGEQ